MVVGVVIAAVVLIVGIVVFLVHENGGCKGGINQFSLPTYVSNNGKDWTATYGCYKGGTTSIPVPAGQFPNTTTPG
jgi:hypothetical protein